MNGFSPKIKLILLILTSPMFSFLSGDAGISAWSEMDYLLGDITQSAPLADDSDTSEKDFSVYQLSFHAVNLTSDLSDFFANPLLDTMPSFSNSLEHLSLLSKRVFLISQQFHSSYLHGHHQHYTLARYLLWDVFLI